MKDIKLNIILFLSQNYDWITAKDIASNLNTSVRSVKYHVSLINDDIENAILSSNKGYKINRIIINKIISAFSSDREPINYLERKNYILRELLVGKKEIDIVELADNLFISLATLQNELSRIRTELLPKKIKLHIKKDILSISGTKEDIQKYYLELIKNEVKDNFFQIDNIQKMFNKVDLRIIEKILNQALAETEYFLDNYSMISMILHLALLFEFANRTNLLKDGDIENSNIIINEHITTTVISILEELKTIYGYTYTKGDIFEICVLLTSKLIYQDVERIEESSIQSYVGPEVDELLHYIVENVEKNYSINLKRKRFMVRFSFHLQKLLSRATLELPLSFVNSYIKTDYPLMYSVATYVAYLIKRKTGLDIDEDEIAYIAIHIGVSIEEDNKEKDKLRCIIFSPDHYIIGESIYQKIKQAFSSCLRITNFITTYIELESTSSADLVISTTQININIYAPIIIVSKQIDFNDIKNIYSVINELSKKKKKEMLSSFFSSFFTDHLFYCDLESTKSNEVIDFLTSEMLSKKLVNENFRNNVYERESISPSCYGNIAIPHPLNNDSSVSSVAISIHPNGIKWCDNIINIVIMLSISEKDNNLFCKMFDIIAKPISDEEILKELMYVKTYDEFIDFMSSYV